MVKFCTLEGRANEATGRCSNVVWPGKGICLVSDEQALVLYEAMDIIDKKLRPVAGEGAYHWLGAEAEGL